MLSRSSAAVDHGGRLHRLVHALEPDPGAGEARHREAVEPVVDDLLHARRIEDRDHHVDEVEFGLVRGGGRFGGVVVAHQRQHAAVLRGAGEIGVAEDVAGAVDARPLAVPDAEHAVVLALAAQLGLLRAPQRGGGEVLVDARAGTDVARGEMRRRALELVVEPAERRAAIAGDVARGVEAGAAVALVLHHRQPHQRLIAGDEHAALGQVVLVVERDVIERHSATRIAPPVCPGGAGPARACELCRTEIVRTAVTSNAAARDRRVISRLARRNEMSSASG